MNDRGAAGPGHDPWTVALCSAASPRTTVGCGVLIDRQRVLTCWHVVDGKHGGGTAMFAAFPKAGVPRSTRVEVADVRGYRDLDVAVLRLAGPAPAEATPAPLRSPRPVDLAGDQWWAFGFPRDAESGSDAYGQVGIPLSYGRVRLDTRSRYVVRAGFSGTGVWSRDFNAVVGLVVQAQVGGRNAGDAEAITFHQLEREMPDEGLHELTVWSIAMAGEAALEAWGWSLSSDVEAVRHWRPRARGVSVDTEGGYRFRGRTTALTEISEWLRRSRPDTRVLLVTGSPGVGKSAVLGRIVTTADRGVRDAIPAEDHNVCAPLGSIACAVHVKGKTALDVAVEIARAASVRLPHIVDDLVPALQQKMARDRRPGWFNLVVDALDEATSPAQARLIVSALLLPIVRTCSRFGAQVVVGSRHGDDGGDLLRRFGPGSHVIDLDQEKYFAEEDLEEYALATLALEGNERPGNPYAAGVVARPVARKIASLADRNFLIAGLTARYHGLYDEEAVDPVTLSFTATVDEALAEYLARLQPVEGVLATTLLTALAYAQAPGISMELWRVALEALEVAVSREALAFFAGSSAANFLVETSDDAGTARYRLFHQALNDALVRQRPPGNHDERALALHFIRHGRHVGWARSDPYLLRSLPAYAARAGMIDALLTDDAFLLHADLPRLTHLAEYAQTRAGRDRARLLRLTPHAINAPPVERAALFGVTAELEQFPDAFTTWRGVPYRARWASVPSRAEHSVLEGHAGAVNAICAVPVNRRPHLATVGDFGYVRLWDPATGRHWDLPVRGGVRAGDPVRGPFFAVCPVPAGGRTLLAAAGRGGRVHFVDPAERRPAGTLGDSGATVRALCVATVDGSSYLVSGGDDGMIRMWNLADGRARSFLAHNGPVRSVTTMWESGRQVVLSSGDDYTARIWDLAETAPIGTMTSHVDKVRAARAIRVGSRNLLATANFTEALVWERRGTVEALHLTGHTRAVLAMETFHLGDRTVLATGSADGDIRVWDPREGRCLRVLSGHTEAVNAICTVVLDDHAYLATASRDRTARLWDLAADGGAAGARHRGSRVSAATAVQVRTRAIAGVDGGTGVIRLQDAETGTEIRSMAGRIGSVNSVCTVKIGLRDFIVVASDSGVIQTWDPLRGIQLLTEIRRYERIQAICPFRLEDGQTLLAITGNGRTIQLCRPDNGRIVQRPRLPGLLVTSDLLEHLRHVRVMRQVPGDPVSILATAGDDVVMLWSARGRHLGSLRGHQQAVRALATATLDGRTVLASAGDDQTIRLWNPWSRGQIGHFTGHTDAINAIYPLTVDDRPMLASGSRDRTVKIWDLQSQSLALSIPVHYPVLTCLEVSGLLFVGLTAGSLALDLNTAGNDLPHFPEV